MLSEVVAGVYALNDDLYTNDGYDSEYYDGQEAYDSIYVAAYDQEQVVKSERKSSGFFSRY
ncbi:hypothetical protein GN244_ATG19213 [Phytophthora infestans]|uniref:Uncharacterized protein n=1 Tax=Phytophthora infestans TaxID=4787 RepID=A0A833VUC7_PHYIN|nr:hypothetical protein GN244_ATG19213 [Phytophthora infestans]